MKIPQKKYTFKEFDENKYHLCYNHRVKNIITIKISRLPWGTMSMSALPYRKT